MPPKLAVVYPGLAAAAAARARAEQQRPAAEERQRRLREASRTTQWSFAGGWWTRRLGEIPFWCGDERLHLDAPNDYWCRACCTQHVFGLPLHRITGRPSCPAPHQLRFAEDVITRRERDPDAPIFHHLNKGRQMGFTEIAVRILAHQAFGAYAGRNVGIMAATNGRLAQKDLRRLYRLFGHVPQVVAAVIRSGSFGLVNGTEFHAFAASEEAITGDTQYGAILMDEAAKWRLIDDKPVFNSVEPIVYSSGADLLLISTPKGPQKMFYRIHKEPRDYVKHLYTLWDAQGSMYTAEQIRHMIATSQADPQQEYLGQFTLGEDSVFGIIDDDERVPIRAWDDPAALGAAPDAVEDDSYREPGRPPRDGEWPEPGK